MSVGRAPAGGRSPRYFEDFVTGHVFELGSRTIDASEIVDFARQWDPFPFHTDPEAAKSSAFGGLVASGWHTVCVFMRLYVDGLLASTAAIGSPGLTALRWRAPVRPGDTLFARMRVGETRRSKSTTGRGTVDCEWEMTNQRGEVVLSAVVLSMFRVRPERVEQT